MRKIPHLGVALWALVVAAMIVLMYESVKPVDSTSLVATSDKVAHAAAYALLAAIVVVALRHNPRRAATRVALIAFVWATAYGALAEVVQSYVGRTADVWDALANAAGAGLTVLAFLRLVAVRRPRARD